MWTAIRNGRPPLMLRSRSQSAVVGGGVIIMRVGIAIPAIPTIPTIRTIRTFPSSQRAPPNTRCRHSPSFPLGQTRQYRRGDAFEGDMYQKTTPLAKRLSKQPPWNGAKGGRSPLGDKTRVHIINPKLVEDTLKYLGDDLVSRHSGCDIIDIYPGAALWSTQLNTLLKPRSHILMETDPVYDQFLEPLLQRDGVQQVRESGLIWTNLLGILNKTMFPHQVEHAIDTDVRTRNDTLLVTCNLSFFPAKKWGAQSSLGMLVLYQFVNAIASASLFHKYGLVRMLIWTRDDEKYFINPHGLQSRRRTAVEAEMYTDWIHEVVSADSDAHPPWNKRELDIDILSAIKTAERMRKANIKFPPHRRSQLQQLIDKYGTDQLLSDIHQGLILPYTGRPWVNQLEELEAQNKKAKLKPGSEDHTRLKRLGFRRNLAIKSYQMWQEAIAKIAKVEDAYVRGDVSASAEEDKLVEWLSDTFTDSRRNEMDVYRENIRTVQIPEARVSWDRRMYEPLIADQTEFYPNCPLSLLDIQPKSLPGRLLERGPGTSRAGNFFDIILKALFNRSKSLDTNLKYIWFGAAEAVLENTPSLKDPQMGGTMLQKVGQVSSRRLTEKMVLEALDAFMTWPFRPTYTEFLAKSSHYDLNDEDLDGVVKEQAMELKKKGVIKTDDEDDEKAQQRKDTIMKLAVTGISTMAPIDTPLEKLLGPTSRSSRRHGKTKVQPDRIIVAQEKMKEENEEELAQEAANFSKPQAGAATTTFEPKYRRSPAEMEEAGKREARIVAELGMSRSRARKMVKKQMSEEREAYYTQHLSEKGDSS